VGGRQGWFRDTALTEEALTVREHNESDPVETTKHHDDREADLLDPDAEEPGVAGGGGPAAIIYGEEEEAEKHGDRLAREPDDSV
jgi:hypothetical protein